MTKQDFNAWLANQIKNQHLESLWNLTPGLVAKDSHVRAQQIRFGVKLAMAEEVLNVNKDHKGWSDVDVRDRARIVVKNTVDRADLSKVGVGAEICQFSELERRILVQITDIEAGMIGDRILESNR